MYWYVLARWSGPLERIMVGIGAWFRRPQPWSQGAGRGRMVSASVAGRVLKKVRRLAKPLQAAVCRGCHRRRDVERLEDPLPRLGGHGARVFQDDVDRQVRAVAL